MWGYRPLGRPLYLKECSGGASLRPRSLTSRPREDRIPPPFSEAQMPRPRNRDQQRSFYETLEDRPPASRFLLAANPPSYAASADIRHLVKKSFGLRYSNIPGMYHYAKLARCLADAILQQDPESQDAKGEAWLQFGNVLRILGHFQSARRAFDEAELKFSKGTRPPNLYALLWELRGSLYRDWRDFAHSEQCLATAIRFHSQSGDRGDSSRCLVARALCAGEGGDPGRAVRLAERAILRINRKKQPDLAIAAVHVMCWFLVDSGQPTLALASYIEAEPLFKRPKGSSRNKCLSSGGSPEDELCSSTHRESCRVGYQGPRLPSG